MKPLPQQSPAAALADAAARADLWERENPAESDAPPLASPVRTSVGSGRKATLRLLCVEMPGQTYTVKEAAALAEATTDAVLSGCKHCYACGPKKLHFVRMNQTAVLP